MYNMKNYSDYMKWGKRIMAVNKYAGTKTEKNLQEAFAGESQARIQKVSCTGCPSFSYPEQCGCDCEVHT